MLASRSSSSGSADSLALLLVGGLAEHVAEQLLDRAVGHGRQPVENRHEAVDQLGAAGRRSPVDAADAAGGVQQARAVARRVVGQALDGRLADAAGRRVDHAQQGHLVAGIVQQLQVGQDVLDLLALEEFQAVDHLVGDALLAQGEFQRPAQGVGAIEDGEIAGAAAAAADLPGDPRGDVLGLVALVGVGDQADRLARRRSRCRGPFLSAARYGRSARRPPAGCASCCDSSAPGGRRGRWESRPRTPGCCSDWRPASRRSTGPDRR